VQHKNFPKEDEIVLCTVSRIFPTTVFCKLDGDREGVIPISELAPGRIRNIRDYVKEDKKLVCKILKVDESKGHITLSLRRVTLKDRKQKLENYKRDKNSKAILRTFYEKSKIKIEDKTIENIKEKYGSIFIFFQSTLEDKGKISELGVKKADDVTFLHNLIRERVKPKKVKITLDLEIKTKLPDGVEKIKKALNIKNVTVKYISAPLYRLEIESENAKESGKLLQKEAENLEKEFKNFGEVKIKN